MLRSLMVAACMFPPPMFFLYSHLSGFLRCLRMVGSLLRQRDGKTVVAARPLSLHRDWLPSRTSRLKAGPYLEPKCSYLAARIQAWLWLNRLMGETPEQT